MLFRKLKADEIECRVSRVNDYGVYILLYKDARCDMNILDETVGPMGWMRSHTRDNANCIVSIWDEEKKQWISKEDTGTESNTEKEKGLASDSFKRACFNWGIGRELYTAPEIRFGKNQCGVSGNKCYDEFRVEKIGYEGNGISELSVKNYKTGSVFTYNIGNSVENNQAEEDREKLLDEFCSELKRTNIKVDYFLAQGGVGKVEDLRSVDIEAAITALKAKPSKGK